MDFLMLRASVTHATFFLRPLSPAKIFLIIADEILIDKQLPTGDWQGDLHALRVHS
jgi:hypothetical protein